jgi:predicted GNAT family acetyltransferase
MLRPDSTERPGRNFARRTTTPRSSPNNLRSWAWRSIVIVAVQVHDKPDEQRYEAVVDGELAGFAAYHTQPGLLSFVHTEIEDAFEGRGVGSILIREALEDVRRRGLEVLPFCPFVNSFIAEHREFVDLVPGSRREEFGL